MTPPTTLGQRLTDEVLRKAVEAYEGSEHFEDVNARLENGADVAQTEVDVAESRALDDLRAVLLAALAPEPVTPDWQKQFQRHRTQWGNLKRRIKDEIAALSADTLTPQQRSQYANGVARLRWVLYEMAKSPEVMAEAVPVEPVTPPPSAPVPRPVRKLCPTCGGNGTLHIPGGLTVCTECRGDYWVTTTPVGTSACAPVPPSAPADLTLNVCGGSQARICPVTKQAHDMSVWKMSKDGGSRACKDCGATAMNLDLMELP